MSHIDVSHLSVRFGDFYAVNDVSFGVKKGEIFGFLGANGAGKTTTIRVLCGLLEPTEGSASLGGQDVSKDALAIKKNVGYMSQKFTLYNDLTIEENMNFTASLRKLKKETYLEKRQQLFDFIELKDPLSTTVGALSGGTKQKVSLATCLLHDPDFIFLDEPTAGVSPHARKRFWELIGQLSHSGKTILVTTHYMDEAEQCHRVALMNQGKLVALDTVPQLKQHYFPDHAQTATLEDVFIKAIEVHR